MLPEHERRFRRIVSDYLERPAGDYGELLRRGRVSSPDGADPEQWRAEIRAQARRDKIRVMTRRHGDRAFAVLSPSVAAEDEDELIRREFARADALRQLAARARELGHEPGPWLRHDEESVAFCSHCDARIYVRIGEELVSDGEALTESCRAA